jgi:predicted acetyltransferase
LIRTPWAATRILQEARRSAGGCPGWQYRRMNASTQLCPLTDAHRPVVERLWQLYSHDLSEFRGSMPDAEGRYKPGRLPLYFDDPDRCGYLIVRDSAPAGFVLVRGLAGDRRIIGEFFVVRAARRQHVGHEAAAQVLAMHPGCWEIAFQEENPGAARFWRRVATEVAGPAWRVESRPVPGKPDVPPDTWLLLTAARGTDQGL